MTTDNYNMFSAGAAERLIKSADALDFALQSANNNNNNKKTTATNAISRQGLFDFGSLDSIFGGTTGELSATLFDDWLANDLQQVGFMAQDEPLSSSSSDSDSSNSPRISNESDSPVVGFDSIASDAELIQSAAGLDASMALFPEVQQPSSSIQNTTAFGFSTPATMAAATAPAAAAAPTPLLSLTPEAVQQAAAALNIPWSKSLETAVLAQSLLASIPMALQLKPATTPLSPATAPATPATQASSTTSSPIMSSKQSERAVTPESPITPSAATQEQPSSTPRTSLSILSSTQTPISCTSSVKATLYKSAYRSATLPHVGLKRDRKYDEPPSVLDGRDVSEMDEIALKRAKNTDAARRSRHKKLVRMEGLEQRVAELEVENSMFETKLNEVELERSLLADKDQMQQARIQELESMLTALREKLY
ncbi:hypothetical protein BGZ65_001409 [Modicella reniformis]|uniref:BZIP domain-containing protein n=1 Tax=Modicella reniformis TaxID=1440133 RepID=A0A9P6J1P2_9FUNG|nr:hypothetical protein BGZ65_001409 [Modicella reniformis]